MKIIDLSVPLDANFSAPQPPFSLDHVEMKTFRNIARDGFHMTKLTVLTHTGTHMDAPAHVLTREEKEGMYYVDDVPLEQLYGEAVVLDIPKGELEPITAKDFENASMEVRAGDIVLVHTGWGRFDKKEPKNWHYTFFKRPGLDVDGAEWLISKKIKAYGQDTVGTQSRKYSFVRDEKAQESGIIRRIEPVHTMMLKNNIILLEHLTNLDKVVNRRIIAGFFPLALKGVEAAPIRALAFLDE